MSAISKFTATGARQNFVNLLTKIGNDFPVQGKLLFDFFNDPIISARWFATPGSTAVRFHHAYDGGLVVHVMEVLDVATKTAEALGALVVHQNQLGFKFTDSLQAFVPMLDLWMAVLLHDVNKIGDAAGNSFYVPNMIKNGTVRSDKVPYETSDKLYSYRTNPMETSREAKVAHAAAFNLVSRCWRDLPDGELSLAIIAATSPMLFDALSPEVRFAIRHHDGAYGRARRDLTGNESPLQMMLHFGDMWSSRMAKEGYR